MTVRIGIIDSGAGEGVAAAAARFVVDSDGAVDVLPARADRLGHGTAVAELILRRAPTALLYVAQVFDKRGLATPLTVAAGLNWLVGRGVRLVNMSLGLTEDREPLRQACAQAVAAGVLIVASVPAMGPQVYPAAYPGLVRVTGDGRCRGDQVAAICSDRADLGADPAFHARAGGNIAGASVAAARITGALAATLIVNPEADPNRLVQELMARAHHHGPQRAAWHG